MTMRLLAAAALLLSTTAGVRADDADHMAAAKADLQSARGHLKSAERDFDGHRKQALELVERALNQVNDGIKVGDRHDAKDDKKVKQLEQKQEKIQKQIDKLDD